ncbi:glycosyltransferase [Paraglaciecola polaris]|uniref:glycosyltransferase n=1 Tax=Paraglaciecola polaris TaxID=222814 RepID=UPI0030EC8919
MALISFVIPTHNRYKYAVKTILSLLSISDDIEVVVSDSSEENLLSDFFVGHEKSSQLKIVRPGKSLSVVDNFNFGLSEASGEYLVFLGDDDFACDDIFQVAQWAKSNSIDSVKFSFPVNYYWPDFKHRNKGDHFSGTLNILEFTGIVENHDLESAIKEALNDFGRGVLDLPRAYSGMISKKLADNIVSKHGALFGGVSPDIYSSTLIASMSKKAYKIDFPVVVPGASGASTSGLSATGKHTGGLRDNPHIGAFKNLIWDKRIPEFYSVPTVWSYSFLKALEKTDRNPKEINFSRLYVRCFIYYPQYYSLSLISLRQYIKDIGAFRAVAKIFTSLLSESLWVSKILGKRALRKNNIGKQIVISDLCDVIHAKKYIDGYIVKNNMKIKW